MCADEGKVPRICRNHGHFPETLITLRNGCAEQCGVVHSRPRPDLTFVYTTHCKSEENNIHHEKLVWISRASEPLRIHTYKILLQ